MKRQSRLGLSMVAALALLACAGCDGLFEKDPSSAMEAASKKVAAGDFRTAIKLYEAALDGTPKTAEVHYRLALVYDDKLKNARGALHHMERYLEFAPKGTYAKEALAYRREGEHKLLTSLSGGKLITQDDAVRIKNDNLLLTKKLNDLRAQKNLPTAAATPPRGETAQRPVPAGARTHVVKSGETLASIAQKYYRNRARWKDLQDANFYSLEGTPKIKAGQVLIVPEK